MADPAIAENGPRRRASLAELGLGRTGCPDFSVSGLSSSSRTVVRGELFAALPGSRCHGARFVEDAAERGAAAVLTDSEGQMIAADRADQAGLPLVVVDNPRAALAVAASRWFGKGPDTVAAVTGTNGKTSVVSICQQIWQLNGRAAASFGTLGVQGAWSARLNHTTPDPITLHRRLAQSAAAGVTHVAMEASSHGLTQHRLDGAQLCAAAFTNLTHDHLDYHGSKEAYFNAKAGLFDRVLPRGRTAVICMLSGAGAEMAEVAAKRGQRVISVGGRGSSLALLQQQFTRGGQLLRFSWDGRIYESALGLIGGFQAWNALTAAGLAIAAGEDPDRVFSSISDVAPVRGRLQLAAKRQNGAVVFVDYAHTPDALRASLTSLRQHFTGRLVALFGAGGDRDRMKRPLMGEAARRHADAVIITDDNPRREDPARIRSEILRGCPRSIEIADRAEAIARGADMLGPGDVLLVAGKGHESGQEVAGAVLPFDDCEQASIAVNALDGTGA